MSAAEFSKYLQDRVLRNVHRSFQETRNLNYSLDADHLRDPLEKATSGHTGVFTSKSWDRLVKQFNNTDNKFALAAKGERVSGKSLTKHAPYKLAVAVLNNFDSEHFINWVGVRKDLPGFRLDTDEQESLPEELVTKNRGTLILRKVSQGHLKSLLLKYLVNSSGYKASMAYQKWQQDTKFVELYKKDGSSTTKFRDAINFISLNLQAGHLAGVFSLRYSNLFQNRGEQDNVPKETERALEDIKRLIFDWDYLTSNLPDQIEIVAIAEKDLEGKNKRGQILAHTELQLSGLNSASGKAFEQMGKIISKMRDRVHKAGKTYDPSANEFAKDIEDFLSETIRLTNLVVNQATILKNSEGLALDAIEKALTNAQNIQAFLETKGSPSILDLILSSIANTVQGKSTSAHFKTQAEKKINNPQIQKAKQLSKKAKKDIDTAVTKIKSVSSKVKAEKVTVPTPLNVLKGVKNVSRISTVSISSLMTLINANLHEQLRKNMRSPALNYQTGRFAKSAKVERMSESRAGMITAFYSYMKSPYQTFEPGFKQGSEARNPKTLISKSIREIAATMVGNRMRAVRI